MSLSGNRVRTSIDVYEIARAAEPGLSAVETQPVDPSLRTDENGIHEFGDGRCASFEDPDGNTFALER